MIDSYVISIREIDDPDDAVKIFREKLAAVELKKNSLGILTCHPDAVYSGVYKAVRDVLPFPVAGITCDEQSVGNINDEISSGKVGTELFSVMILTGDDCEFVGCSCAFERAGECFSDLRKKSSASKLALLYTPFNPERFPGECLEAISAVDSKIPVFGAISGANNTVDAHNGILTLWDGAASQENAVIVLISGDFTPQFYISSFTEKAVVLKNVGAVTKCERNMIYEINGVNAAEFLSQAGFSLFAQNADDFGTAAGFTTCAFVLENQDGENDNRVISRTPAAYVGGGIFCLGYIREGATLSVAIFTYESVVETASEILQKVSESNEKNKTVLMYSCLGRRDALLGNSMEELNLIQSQLGNKMNHIAAYGAGEICPTLVTPEKACNYEHNQTLIACIF